MAAKKTPAPQTPFSFSDVKSKVFSNIDPETGMPVLKETILDKYFRKGNEIGSDQFRNLVKKSGKDFGWTIPSDVSSIKRGAAVLGLKKAVGTPGTMGGQSGSTEKDLIAAAAKVGLDPANFMKQVTTTGAMGAKGPTVSKLDRNALYDAIDNQLKGVYVVSGALEGSSHNKIAPHATIMFKSDGQGNLVPITNQEGAPIANTFKAVRNATSPWYADVAPIAAMALPFVLPGVGSALSSAIGNTALGAAIGPIGTSALTGATLGAGTTALGNVLTGRDLTDNILKGALVGGAGGALTQVVPEALGSDFAKSTFGTDLSKIPGVTPGLVTTGTSLAGGQDIGTALERGVISGASTNIGTNVAKETGSPLAGNFAGNLTGSALSGVPITEAALSALTGAGKSYVGDQFKQMAGLKPGTKLRKINPPTMAGDTMAVTGKRGGRVRVDVSKLIPINGGVMQRYSR